MLGKETMATLFNYTLQTDDSKSPEIYDLKAAHENAGAERAVLISLGGNDYNHQKGHIPSNETFTAAYISFLDQLLTSYGYAPEGEGSDDDGDGGLPAPTLISVCGQGSPVEAKQDPDNNRCRPCPHVEAATEAYNQRKTSAYRAEYIFVPCDGTVVTGAGDIGCAGHKNAIGQGEVAAFVGPKVREIMGWN